MKTYFWRKYRIKKIGDSLSILNQKTSFYKPMLLILPTFITILLFTLIPFILVITQAFSYQYGFKDSDRELSLKNFASIFNEVGFQIGIRNSLIYGALALPISLIISLLISTAIVQVVKKWARGFWQTVFFLPYVTSAIAVSLSFFYLFKRDGGMINIILKKMGLIKENIAFLDSASATTWNAFWVMIIRGVWGNLAFQILILTTAMLSVDQQLYKAGAIDGSSKRKQFFQITLPSINKTISFLVTMGLIGGIKTMPLALFNNDASAAISNGGSSIMLYIYKAVSEGKYDIAAAASIILFIIGIAFSFGLRKIVSLIYKASTKIGEANVLNRIENSTLKSKVIFKI